MLPLRLLLSLILIDRCWSLYEIDWNQCFAGSSRSCYVDGNCVPTVANSSRTLQQLTTFENLISRKSCNIGIQTRTYSDSKLLIILQVLDQGNAGDSSELALYQGEDLLAGCKRTNGGFDILGQDKSRSLALYKDATHFNDNHMVCAFTIYRPAEFTKSAKQQLVTNLRFSVGSGSTRSMIPLFAKGKFVFQMSQSVTCNPDDIIMQRSIEDHHVVPIKDINRDVLDCTNQDTSLGYTLMYTDVNSTSTEIKSVSCVPLDESAVNLEYAWHIIFKTNMTPLAIDDPQQFAFSCATKISKMCANPVKCSGDDCPVFNAGTETSDAKIRCPNNKWIIDGDYHLGIQPYCKAEMTKMNTANFYLKLGDSEVDFTNGKCFTNYDCDLKSHLEYSNCEREEDGCAVLIKSDEEIYCKNGQDVKVHVRQMNKTMSASKFFCDVSTGQWKDENKEAIPEFSLVMCQAVLKAAEKEKMDILTILIPLFVGLPLLILLVVLEFWYSYRKLGKNQRIFKGKLKPKKWKKLKPAERARIAKEIFKILCEGDLSLATIEDGLQVVDSLLDTEMEEPDVWEAAQEFLERLRGAVQNYDQPLYEKIGRYLFLRAKKIIDKHGWKTQEPVRDGRHKGYIITVAVQLLGNAMYSSPTNDDAEQLIVEGFRELRYAANAAYPQCGVLWSLMTQMVIRTSRKGDTVKEQDIPLMIIELKKILESESKETTVEDPIPQHGGLRQQVQTAFVCSTQSETMQQNFEKADSDYLDGLCKNLFYQDAAAIPIRNWMIQKETGEEKKNKDKKKEPSEEYKTVKGKIGEEKLDAHIIKMMRVQANNMKVMDARLLEMIHAFPKKRPPSGYYTKLSLKASEFYATVETTASSIDSWLTSAIQQLEKCKSEKQVVIVTRPHPDLVSKDYSGVPKMDEQGYVEDAQPIRQKECNASPEMQALCRKLLDKLFCKKTYCGVKWECASSDMLAVVLEVRKILATEPILIEDVPADTYVVADIHGQFHDLFRYLTSVNSPNEIPGYKGGRQFVFTGDYVDRGTQSVDVVLTLFCLKILYPDKFILLRGNHEDVETNSTEVLRCFLDRCMQRFGENNGANLYKQISITFCYLSFAAIVGGKVFCAHAGPTARPVNKHYFRKLSKPIYTIGKHSNLSDLAWADPAIGLTGTSFNGGRFCSIYYSETTVDFFLKSMGCTALVRGHEIMTPGYDIQWNRLITLFSSASEKDNELRAHSAAILHISSDIKLQILKSQKNLKRCKPENKEADAPTDFNKENEKVEPAGGTGAVTVIQA